MIRTRFSPSPTGMLHIGNVRTALFSALFAANQKGAFLLRIEDTDATRSEQKYVDILQDDLNWLGIFWQEGPTVGGPHQPYYQSQRHAIYDKYYRELVQKNLVYPCFCTDQELALNRKIQLSRGQAPRYPGTCRKLTKEEVERRLAQGLTATLRFQVPLKMTIEFDDLVKGVQRFNSDDIGDFIIRRADGSSSFLFSNAIDDALMEITHVLRGDDHLANTPRQLMLMQALNLPTPRYAHLSMITGDDGTPLSKRHGSFSLHDFREQGYLPLAILNYLGRLSHTYEQQVLMTLEELGANFNIEKCSRAPARFDVHQLLHWQKEAVMILDNHATENWLQPYIQDKIPAAKREAFTELMRKNILFPQESARWMDVFFGDALQFDAEQINVLNEAGDSFFVLAEQLVKKHGVDIKNICDELKQSLNISGKKLFMPVRVALTAEQHGPELVHIANLLGPEKMLQHFKNAHEAIKK